MKVPDFFKLKSGKEEKTKIFLPHNHITTTDFFHIDPVVCREVVPGDEMNIDITSFVRFFPMPFPVLGRIKYYNRVFFVPYRLIMEGFNHFITDTKYPSSSGLQAIDGVPQFKNSSVCSTFLEEDMSEEVGQKFYWRDYGDSNYPFRYLVNNVGKICTFSTSTSGYYTSMIVYYKPLSIVQVVVVNASRHSEALHAFGTSSEGTYTASLSSGVYQYLITSAISGDTEHYCLKGNNNEGFEFVQTTISSISYVIPDIATVDYSQVSFDFMYDSQPSRFTNKGRFFYNLLTRLGYRIDFTTSATDHTTFTNDEMFSAGKLLAYVKVYLDWYTPSQYAQENDLLRLFYGINYGSTYSHKYLTSSDLYEIASIQFGCYDRDYFTSAWQNPSGPNVADSTIILTDNSVSNVSGYKSQIRNNSPANSQGSSNGTPTITGLQGSTVSSSPANITYYVIESLRAFTNWMRRHQLSGYRTIDRYLAQYGSKLEDDRVQRCYYLGGYEYDAQISDIMSTSDTDFASLGDYAGKGIAYSDAHRSFHLDEVNEYGFVIVLSSVVPETGYVQGYMRENRHLTRFDHFLADFDNLGTQAIEFGELFADRGLRRIDQNTPAGGNPWTNVFGFTPRYMEYKIGYDLLTGDFNIPSRREGMDSFHLFRLFPTGVIDSINRGFTIGEQTQYDRIFNNVSDDYDHMYIVHRCNIEAYRRMKSASEVYDFEHAPGREITVDANGTQLN